MGRLIATILTFCFLMLPLGSVVGENSGLLSSISFVKAADAQTKKQHKKHKKNKKHRKSHKKTYS